MAILFPRFCVALLAGTMLLGPAYGNEAMLPAQQQRLCLRGPVDMAVAFHGAVNYDKVGRRGTAMTVAVGGGLVGMMISVAVHAAVSDSTPESEKERVRRESDVVVAPYREVLDRYKHEELMRASSLVMSNGGDKRVIATGGTTVAGELTIDTVPTFYLTQDQRAIIVENAVRIDRGTGNTYEKIIRVISSAQAAMAGPDLWLANEAALLKSESARIYVQSLDIAVNDLAAQKESSEPFKTVRYVEGGAEKMERAQVIGQQCSHLVLRTLRGDVLAVPRKTIEEGCKT